MLRYRFNIVKSISFVYSKFLTKRGMENGQQCVREWEVLKYQFDTSVLPMCTLVSTLCYSLSHTTFTVLFTISTFYTMYKSFSPLVPPDLPFRPPKLNVQQTTDNQSRNLSNGEKQIRRKKRK